ncbi:UNVERIFIED_CONTAM: hypothetical protein FKN15_024221 [Acipenser sinensis]
MCRQPTAFFHTADLPCSHLRATASEDNAALGQLTGKPADAWPDYRGRWCAVSRGHPGNPPATQEMEAAKQSFFALRIHSEAIKPIVPEHNTDLNGSTADPQVTYQPQGRCIKRIKQSSRCTLFTLKDSGFLENVVLDDTEHVCSLKRNSAAVYRDSPCL